MLEVIIIFILLIFILRLIKWKKDLISNFKYKSPRYLKYLTIFFVILIWFLEFKRLYESKILLINELPVILFLFFLSVILFYVVFQNNFYITENGVIHNFRFIRWENIREFDISNNIIKIRYSSFFFNDVCRIEFYKKDLNKIKSTIKNKRD